MKKTRIRPVSKSPARQAELRCNQMYSDIIHWLFREMCAVCGHKHTDEMPCDPHHLVKRSKDKKVQHTIFCSVLLCRHECHRKAEDSDKWMKAFLEQNLPLHFDWWNEYRWVKGKVDYDRVMTDMNRWKKLISQGRVPPIQPVWQLDEVAAREYIRRASGLIIPDGVTLD